MKAQIVFAIYSAILVTIGGGIGGHIASKKLKKVEAQMAELEKYFAESLYKIQTQAPERTSDRIIDDAVIRMKVAKAFETALDNHYAKVLVKKEEA